MAHEALAANRMATLAFSISGVQPKWTAHLDLEGDWVVDRGGPWIVKPPNPLYPYLPELEWLGMRLLEAVGVPVAESGLLPAAEGGWVFLSKRFDLAPNGTKLAMEDFCQLLGVSEERKYHSSLEKVAHVLLKFSKTPEQDSEYLWKIAVTSWLIGNADLHLKNLSMLERQLSPAYDMVPTQLILPSTEEMALSLCGKRSHVRRKHWVDDLGQRILQISPVDLTRILGDLSKVESKWSEALESAPIPETLKVQAVEWIQSRWTELFKSPGIFK